MRRARGRWWLALFCALGLMFAGPASAGRILVLVHGYLGDSASWQQSGVLPVLEQAGWKLAGNWQSTPSGVRLVPAGPAAGEFGIDTVDLPSTAPLMEQARLLGGMLGAIAQRHPTDTVDLIGHSAGGVVARLALVNYALPAPSQDLRRVPALNGRASIRVVAGGHQLSGQDGLLLSELVSQPARAAAAGSR
jgi:pimeloyl-ACP methyl ester carboxylesterase